VLPARRTWEASLSFALRVVSKAVATWAAFPRRRFSRNVTDSATRSRPLECDQGLSPLIERINEQLSQLLPESPTILLTDLLAPTPILYFRRWSRITRQTMIFLSLSRGMVQVCYHFRRSSCYWNLVANARGRGSRSC